MTESTVDVSPARRHIIKRPRLTRLLDETNARIILLVAPAGYGKTTLAREWLEASGRKAVWYTATPAARDVAVLAAGLAKALEESAAGVSERLLSRLRGGDPAKEVEALAEILAEDYGPNETDVWLAIDDYQRAMSPESERFVQRLVDASSLPFMVTSRHRPSWVTARTVLYGEVAELGSTALALTREEAAAVLKARNVPASPGFLALADGWPAIIGLVALNGRLDLREEEVSGPLYDYIAEELFQLASPLTQRHLCRIAVSSSPTLALLATFAGGEAEEIHDEATRLGLWRATSEGCLEIHPLFASFLRGKLRDQGDEFAGNTIRAAIDFFADRRDWDEALDIALRLDAKAAIQVLEKALDELFGSGRLATVRRTLRALGPQIDHPIVDLAEAELAFRDAEYQKAGALATRAADALGQHALSSRAWRVAGDAAFFLDQRELAIDRFMSARKQSRNSRDTQLALWGILVSEAASDVSRALAVLEEYEAAGSPSDPIHVIRLAQARLIVAERQGGMDKALAAARPALHLVPRASDPFARTAFLNNLATILILTGDYDAAAKVAADELDEAITLKLAFVRPYAKGQLASAELGRRRFAAAIRAIRDAGDDDAVAEDIHAQMNCACLRARLALVQGKPKLAVAELHSPPHRAVDSAMLTEYLALRALALACSDAVNESVRANEEAARVCSSAEGRVFVAATKAITVLKMGSSGREGGVTDLLSEVEASGSRDSFITAYRAFPPLLAAATAHRAGREIAVDAIQRGRDWELARSVDLAVAEPHDSHASLTRREREVYTLLAQGLTNREIAATFVLSEMTVKAHVRRILRKLGVRSRTEAAILAAGDASPTEQQARVQGRAQDT